MLNFPCSEIYLLNLYEREDKFQKMKERLEKIGINVIPFRTVKHSFQDKMVKFIKPISIGMENGCVFSCTREHYTIIKSAYLRGLDSVGIMEDDCWFLKDKNIWKKHLSNLPSDWDILRINCLRGDVEEFTGDESYWYKTNRNISGTGFYILNKKAMEYIINYLDKKYAPIDYPIEMANKLKKLNVYLPKIELSLCIEDTETWDSDIRQEIDKAHLFYKTIKRFNKENYI